MFAAVMVAAALAGAPPALCEYRPPEPRPSAEERRLDSALYTRRTYGFPTGRRFVRRVNADPASRRRGARRDLSIGLTEREARYFRWREQLQEERHNRRLSAYLRRQRAVVGEDAIEDDYPRRPYLLIGVTRDVARHRAAIRKRFALRLEVERVRHSFAELQRIQDSISDDVLAAEGIDVVSSGIGAARIELEVTTSRPDAAAVVRRLYGPAVHVEVIAATRSRLRCLPAERYRLDPDGRTLHLTTSGSGSSTPRHVEVVESGDAVEVGMILDIPNGPVTADDVGHELSVTLAAPLGERIVRNIQTRKPVRRRASG